MFDIGVSGKLQADLASSLSYTTLQSTRPAGAAFGVPALNSCVKRNVTKRAGNNVSTKRFEQLSLG